MKKPSVFPAQGEFDLACKLQKLLYCKKPSPQDWFGKSIKIIQ